MRRPLMWFCLLYVMLRLGIVLVEGVPYKDIDMLRGQELVVTGRVADIDRINQVIYLTGVTFSKTCDNTRYEFNNVGIICYQAEANMPRLGSNVEISGKVAPFSTKRNPGEFDLRQYYFVKGYDFALKDSIMLKESEEYNGYLEGLRGLRDYIGDIIDYLYVDQDAGVLKTMLLGDKSELDKDVRKLYQTSGISHILSISGLHISIIGMCLYSILRRMSIPVLIRCSIATFVMANYAIMTGLGTSTFRAVIMFIMLMLSYECRRTYDLLTSLSLAAAIIVTDNTYVFFNGGFWLSFFAVYGIAIFSKCFSISFERKDSIIKRMYEMIVPCLAVSFFTLPIVLINYYEYPAFSVLLNIIIVPLMSVLMGGVIIICLLYMISAQLAPVLKVMSYPMHLILTGYSNICKFIADINNNSVIFGKPSIWCVILFYVICALMTILSLKAKKKIKTWIRMSIMALLMIFGILLLVPRQGGLTISMIDVGQGDGICIQYGGRTYMVDGGSSSNSKLSEYTLIPFLKSKGISNIDAWFVSHPDMDHVSGLIDMLGTNTGINISLIVLPDSSTIRDDAKDIIETAGRMKVPVSYIGRGDVYTDAKLNFVVLSPVHGSFYDDINAYSEMLLLDYGAGKFRMMFTGDATFLSEQDLLSASAVLPKEVDVLKVGHHGSKTSTSKEFVDVINPKLALISVGANNRYGHPAKDTLNTLEGIGCQVVMTKDHGCITIKVNADGEFDIWYNIPYENDSE